MTRCLWWCRQRKNAALLGILIVFVYFSSSVAQQIAPPKKAAVQVSAAVQESPARVKLSWPNEGDANSYRISKRTQDSGWRELANIGGGETSFSDSDVTLGSRYEYQIIKFTSGGYSGYGYISAGARIPAVDYRGKVILIVENSLAAPLESELNRLANDLIGDGWGVLRRNVSSADSVAAVKEQIRSIFNSDPSNVRAVLLFGHIPVPYSGNLFPDGHPNHQGAWPADVYYGDIDGDWTDWAVANSTAERRSNWNLPGDGKFDESNIPSRVELMVGRVDFNNLTCFANKSNARSEVDLARQYLHKDHAFRFGEMSAERRGLICDNFSDKGHDAIVNSAWRSFSTFFGPNKAVEVGPNGYFPGARQNSYLWSFASGGGSYYYSSGVGTSDDFALNDIRVVFTMWMGSYFGDWNNESNFLRASLGSGSVLTATYSGVPHTLYFPMALGDPIGAAIQLTQNNATNSLYPPWNLGSGQVHIALMGDPTLRMHPVKPPSGLSAASDNSGVRLSWSASSEPVAGYHIYRAPSFEGPYTRLTSDPVFRTSFTDSAPAGAFSYMVRSVKLEATASGSYFNLSQGVFANASSSGSTPPPPPPSPKPPAAPALAVNGTSFSRIDLKWDNVENESGYKLERKGPGDPSWNEIQTFGADTTEFGDATVSASSEYSYRVRAFNDAGFSAYSAEISATTLAAPQPRASARFLEADESTAGNWRDRYGSQGFAIPPNLGELKGFTAPAAATWTWSSSTDDIRALSTASTAERVAAAWYGDKVEFTYDSPDHAPMALYFLDWDRASRMQTITVLDEATGVVLDHRDVSAFGNGKYLIYETKGQIRISMTRKEGPNAVLMGVFAGSSVPAPISDKPLTLALQQSQSGAVLRVSGDSGQTFKLLASEDFQTWIEVYTNTLKDASLEIPVSRDLSKRQKYFRAVNHR